MSLKWEKLGRIFDPREHHTDTWKMQFAQSPSALLLDDCLRVYFCTRPAPDHDGQYVSLLSYVDLDRRDPCRVISICRDRILNLGGYGTFDEFGTNPVSAIRDGDEVRVYYAGWTRCESVPFNAAIGMAVSRDQGRTFKRIGEGPVLSYSSDEPFLLGSPRIRKFGSQWRLWYVSGKRWLRTEGRPEPVYKIRMAHSDDGVNWVKLGRDLLASRLGEDECQACPDVIHRDGGYHMFFSYRQPLDYKSGQGGYRIGYAFSADGLQWRRHDGHAGMSVSESGWDAEMVSYPHVFDMDDRTYMLYQGNQMGQTGIGLARLVESGTWVEP